MWELLIIDNSANKPKQTKTNLTNKHKNKCLYANETESLELNE